MTAPDSAAMQRLLDQQSIADVVYRYCRGIDRCDFDLVRDCYHPDATDDHGEFRGSVDEFIDYVQRTLATYERTMHFIGNLLVDVDGDVARVESYVVAHHHIAAKGERPERDYNVGLRYVDDFQRRDGRWRIAAHVCAIEWWRLDPVQPLRWTPLPGTIGRRDRTDVVYAESVADWTR